MTPCKHCRGTGRVLVGEGRGLLLTCPPCRGTGRAPSVREWMRPGAVVPGWHYTRDTVDESGRVTHRDTLDSDPSLYALLERHPHAEVPDDLAVSVACPRCGEPVGVPCRTGAQPRRYGALIRGKPHVDRARARDRGA